MKRPGELAATDQATWDDTSLVPFEVGAVSWGAISAGAAAAAALSLILLILGAGLGLSAVSPWTQDGIGAKGFGVSTIIWLGVTQILASGMGGYLAGRLRTTWLYAQADEIYFRDTAHGFLAWAIATLATAALLMTMIGAIAGSGMQASAKVAGGVAQAAGVEVSTADTQPESPTLSAEVARIFVNAPRTGNLPEADARYVGQVVAPRNDLTQQDAEQRVRTSYANVQTRLWNAEIAAKSAADTARKASVYVALWFFVSLLIGAFVASLAATYGGRQRDAWPAPSRSR